MFAGDTDALAAHDVGLPVATLEDRHVFLERFGAPGALGSYVRFCVTCPCHPDVAGLPCRKRRNVHAAQVKTLGPLEPLAYLGAWLRLAPQCADRASHIARAPTVQETAAFFEEQNW